MIRHSPLSSPIARCLLSFSPSQISSNRTLVQHSRKYAINYNRATLHTTLPMLIAKLYCISNRRSIKIKRIVQKYAVRKFGIPTNRSREARTLLRRCSSRRCDRTNHKLFTWLYENLQELVNYSREEIRRENLTPRRAKWLCATYRQLRGRTVIAHQRINEEYHAPTKTTPRPRASPVIVSKYCTFF